MNRQFMQQNNIKEFTISGADDYKIFRGDKIGSIRMNEGNFQEESFLSAKSGKSNLRKKKSDKKIPKKVSFWDKFMNVCCSGRNKKFEAENEKEIRDAARRSVRGSINGSKLHDLSNMSNDSMVEIMPRGNMRAKGTLKNDENKKLGIPNRVT